MEEKYYSKKNSRIRLACFIFISILAAGTNAMWVKTIENYSTAIINFLTILAVLSISAVIVYFIDVRMLKQLDAVANSNGEENYPTGIYVAHNVIVVAIIFVDSYLYCKMGYDRVELFGSLSKALLIACGAMLVTGIFTFLYVRKKNQSKIYTLETSNDF